MYIGREDITPKIRQRKPTTLAETTPPVRRAPSNFQVDVASANPTPRAVPSAVTRSTCNSTNLYSSPHPEPRDPRFRARGFKFASANILWTRLSGNENCIPQILIAAFRWAWKVLRGRRELYMWREGEQGLFGVSCFKIHTYILGYTTAYKYIKPN